MNNLMISAVLFASSLFLAPVAFCLDLQHLPLEVQEILNEESAAIPENLTEDSYSEWAYENLPEDAFSPYTSELFAWLAANKGSELPQKVFTDPNNIYVNVEPAIAITDKLEQAARIPIARAVGSDIYALIDAPVDAVLKAWKFKMGLPVDKTTMGSTYPIDAIFTVKRKESFLPITRFGDGAYLNLMEREAPSAGVVKAMNNINLIVIRGNEKQGYMVLFQFIKPLGKTTTGSSMAFVLIEPHKSGKTAYKIATRHIGQEYYFTSVVGRVGWNIAKSTLRNEFGFKASRHYAVQKNLHDLIGELKATGTIKGSQAAE